LTPTPNLAFTTTFGGNRVIYMAARDAGGNSGWQTMGAAGVPPLPATFPNPTGSAANLQTVWALIDTAIDGRAACYMAYYRPGNQLYLYPDNGDGNAATNIVLTGNGTIGNSQCMISAISAQGSVVQSNGNTPSLTLPIAFKPASAGFKGLWLAAQTMNADQTSAWQILGAEALPAQ